MTEPLRLSFLVDCPPEHAFAVWTERIGSWWPRDHTVSATAGVEVVLETHVGGRIYERVLNGVEHEWGEVTVWSPSRRLGYRWHLRQNRADATDVDIRFLPEGADGTRVEIEHRGWDVLGAQAPDRRRQNEQGWAGLLPHYQRAASVGPAPAATSPLN